MAGACFRLTAILTKSLPGLAEKKFRLPPVTGRVVKEKETGGPTLTGDFPGQAGGQMVPFFGQG